MSDPIISAVSEHWILAIGFIVSFGIYAWGYMQWRTGAKYHYFGGWCIFIGLIGFADCMIRAFMCFK